MDFGDLVVAAVPFIAPAFLFVSWVLNTNDKMAPRDKKPKGGDAPAESSRNKEGSMTDKDMTSG